MDPNNAYTGIADQQAFASEFNRHAALIKQMLANVPGSTLVQVRSVTNNGALAMVGTVSVQPMVNQIDGVGNATPHGTIYNVPYFRIQGGANAIIIDPVVGDIGVAVFASRDLSSVKATRNVANPGSRRKNSWADGLYLGGFLNGVPVNFIRFSASGIEIGSATITLTGDVFINGTLVNNGVNVGSTHLHGGVMTGGGSTGVPF